MTNETTTTKIYLSDRDWMERLKRKNNKKNSQETIKSIRKVIVRHKMEEELQ